MYNSVFPSLELNKFVKLVELVKKKTVDKTWAGIEPRDPLRVHHSIMP